MEDLTIIYYTSNSMPDSISEKARENLASVKGNYPLISVSQKPMDFGENICVGDIGKSFLNIYRQILIGAKAAKTKYIALAEDDVLYTKEHFNRFRPKDDEVAFNTSKWSIYTWSDPPMFSLKNKNTNTTLISPTELMVDALTERFNKFPDPETIPINRWGEISILENLLGVTKRNSTEFATIDPCIVFSHEWAVGYDIQGTRKRAGQLRAYDIPYWGRAEDVLKRFGYKE